MDRVGHQIPVGIRVSLSVDQLPKTFVPFFRALSLCSFYLVQKNLVFFYPISRVVRLDQDYFFSVVGVDVHVLLIFIRLRFFLFLLVLIMGLEEGSDCVFFFSGKFVNSVLTIEEAVEDFVG